MFLAWTELAGQNVSLSRLFGTLNTPSRIVIINSAGNRGPAESWARRLQSGRRRGFRTNGCSCRWSFTPEQLSTLASPGKHPHTLRGVVWAPEPPSSSLCAAGTWLLLPWDTSWLHRWQNHFLHRKKETGVLKVLPSKWQIISSREMLSLKMVCLFFFLSFKWWFSC